MCTAEGPPGNAEGGPRAGQRRVGGANVLRVGIPLGSTPRRGGGGGGDEARAKAHHEVLHLDVLLDDGEAVGLPPPCQPVRESAKVRQRARDRDEGEAALRRR